VRASFFGHSALGKPIASDGKAEFVLLLKQTPLTASDADAKHVWYGKES